jgi:hypothetical protein
LGAVSLSSALVRAPWPTITLAAALCGIVGSAGAVYAVITARRLLKQSRLSAGVRGLVVHVVLPLSAYVMLVAALSDTSIALVVVAGAVLLLLFTGIDKAWDAVADHVFVNMRDKEAASRQEKISQRDSP